MRAARGFLGMTQAALAEAAGVVRLVVVRFEAEETVPRPESMAKLVEALRSRGIAFTRDKATTGVILKLK
jgi:predicted transcriptional regulator